MDEDEAPLGRKSSKHRMNSGECLLVVNFHLPLFTGCDLVVVCRL